MVYIIKDWKKKRIQEVFITEMMDRNKRSYDYVKEAEKKLKEKVMDMAGGADGIQKMELRGPEDIKYRSIGQVDGFSREVAVDGVLDVRVNAEGEVVQTKVIKK